jgi:hypothetical protein
MSHCALRLFAVLSLVAGLMAVEPANVAGAAKAPSAVKPYPLTTCIVSGEALGTMGAPTVLVQDGQEVKICCKGCIKTFKKDPAKFLKKLESPAESVKPK